VATLDRVVSFLSILGILSPAEQFLLSSIDRSIQYLHNDINILREEQRQGHETIDEIAVLRAEITYSRQIQANFLKDVLTARPAPRDCQQRLAGQQQRQREGRILSVINNVP
jgi:hypothetical protein